MGKRKVYSILCYHFHVEMEAKIYFKKEVPWIAIFFILILETAHAIDKAPCGTVELLGGNRQETKVDGDRTSVYPSLSINVLDGTGSEDLCLSSISYPEIQNRNFVLATFKPFKDKCELLFCGTYRKSGTGDCYKLGNGQGFLKPSDGTYSKSLTTGDFSITSVMCGCSTILNDTTDCTENQCNKEFDDKKFGSCGSVFFESNCMSCRFLPKLLQENVAYESCHETSVKSLAVKPGYRIIRNHNGVYKDTYTESTNFNEKSSTLHGPIGDTFVCQKIPIGKMDNNEKDTKLSAGGIVLIALGVICLLTVLVGGIFLERHMRKRHFRHQFVQIIKDLKASEIGMTNQDNDKARGKHLYDPKWELNRADLKLNSSKVLGSGTFGKVIQGKLVTKDGSGNEEEVEVAVKTFHALDAVVNLNHIKALINEIRVMSFTGCHPNIVRFYGAHIDLRGGHIFCVMELCSKESLLGHLISLRSSLSSSSAPSIKPECTTMQIGNAVENGYHALETIDDDPPDINSNHHETNIEEKVQIEADVPSIFKAMVQWSMDIANGMAFLQQNNILHIDLAARNILLTPELNAKISDFGLSRRLYSSLDEKTGEDSIQKTYKKSPGLDLLPYKYIALESFLGNYSLKSDVWSFGVTLWEIFSCGLEPYCHISEPRILQLFLQSGKRLSSPEYATNDIYCQMLSCWTDEPHLRPDFESMHSFFHSVHESLTN